MAQDDLNCRDARGDLIRCDGDLYEPYNAYPYNDYSPFYYDYSDYYDYPPFYSDYNYADYEDFVDEYEDGVDAYLTTLRTIPEGTIPTTGKSVLDANSLS